mmetsp:Transcript_5881/g.16488  ORF Transcript_5881/g.16488 Transcript_5881/m.16488 type:complete len:111 (+) Transcript_5881:73-405(+)
MASTTKGDGKPSGRSMFGKQADSKKQSMPSAFFGSTTRDQELNRFISIKHTKADLLCRTGPGPIYDPQGTKSVGKQTLSAKKNMPSYGFSTTKRMVSREEDTPGPGSYDN